MGVGQLARLVSSLRARKSYPIPLVFALTTGMATGLLTAAAFLQARSSTFLISLIGLDTVLITVAALVARWLVGRSALPGRRLAEAVEQLAAGRFQEPVLPAVPGEVEGALRRVWEVGRTATAQERGLRAQVCDWEHRFIQARDLLDLIQEINDALGLQPVLDRLGAGLSRFFAGDGVAIWVHQPEGGLRRAVQVAAEFPAQLSSGEPWVQEVLGGATRSVPAPALAHPFASSLAAPLLDPRGVVGVVAMTSVKRPGYTPEEASFLRTVLSHAAVGIQNGIAYDHQDALARLDGLTGLQNRREFDRVFALESERAQRYHVPLSLLLIDIDHFKQVNDRRGHPAGDWALRQVARLVQNVRLRANDMSFRLGGEEFAILLVQTESAGAVAVAERLRQTLAGQALFADGAGLTVSVGVATFPSDVAEPAALLVRADQALYEAKNGGRNRVVAAAAT